jgi:hypothetical protein
MRPRLRVLALTAPQWPVRPRGVQVRSFTAASPFSLQNALREAAGRAANQLGAWADSNWASQADRQRSVLLLEFMDEAELVIRERLDELEPNLVLIGAMTLGMASAVQIARIVRERRGDDCLVS